MERVRLCQARGSSMLKFISRLLHRDAHKAARSRFPVCEWHNTGYGFSFVLPPSREDVYAAESLCAYQILLLQQLLEAGEASSDGSEIHVASDILCRLDDNARDILNSYFPLSSSLSYGYFLQ